jgi:hypothetical protein
VNPATEATFNGELFELRRRGTVNGCFVGAFRI